MDYKLKVATYNIRNTQDQYPKRREQLKATIQSLGADVIGLQEVTLSELDYLAGDYQQFFAPIQVQFPHSDPEFRIDGGAILVRKGIVVLKHEILHISPFRIAQKIELVNVHIINTHLHHVVEDHSIRYHQIQGVLAWLIPLLDQNIILMGDLNLTPTSKEYQYLQEYFQSSYLLANTVEPDVTFPTGLTGPFMDTDPANTLDYIWIKGKLMVNKCSLFGGEQIEEGVYASDHLGIVGEFEIQ